MACHILLAGHNNFNFVGRVRMLDNNDMVLQLVEYDVFSVCNCDLGGGVISDPQDRQRSTTRGLADINWEVEPAPAIPTLRHS